MPDRIWGGLSGRLWAGPVPGAGHCAALPVLSAGKALPVGRPRHASDAFFLRATISTPRSTGISSSRRSSVPSGRFRKKPCCARTSLANWCSWTARVAAWTRSMSASVCGGGPIRSPSPVKGRASTALAGSETLLFASRCSTLALRDEAVLEMQDSLSGILHLHGGTCRVEGVFEAISY